MICPQCRQSVPDDVNFCPHCGCGINQPPPFNKFADTNQQQSQTTPKQDNVFDSGASGRSRGVAALLAILLGYFGGHYFYCGKISAGIICLVLTLVTCGIAGTIIGIMALIQGILMLTMSQEQFEEKYVNTPSAFPLF